MLSSETTENPREIYEHNNSSRTVVVLIESSTVRLSRLSSFLYTNNKTTNRTPNKFMFWHAVNASHTRWESRLTIRNGSPTRLFGLKQLKELMMAQKHVRR